MRFAVPSYSEEGGAIHRKTSIGLEYAGSQQERKTVENLENDRFGGSRKMQQNM